MEEKGTNEGLRRGKNEGLSALFHLESAVFSEYKMEIVMKILDRGMKPFKSLQEPTIFSNKFFSLEAQKVLATFWYKKYYRSLTMAPLGDGAYLKASRTSDLHSLGG